MGMEADCKPMHDASSRTVEHHPHRLFGWQAEGVVLWGESKEYLGPGCPALALLNASRDRSFCRAETGLLRALCPEAEHQTRPFFLDSALKARSRGVVGKRAFRASHRLWDLKGGQNLGRRPSLNDGSRLWQDGTFVLKLFGRKLSRQWGCRRR